MMQNKVIGLTGGIGTGKSSVSKYLHSKGHFIIDCDILARNIVNTPDSPAIAEICNIFGTEFIDEKGLLLRKKLAGHVFGNDERVAQLNEIMHKYIAREIYDNIEKINRINAIRDIYTVIDAPIPIEHGFIDVSDAIWVVTACEETRIDRIIKRDGCTREEALARIKSQKEETEYNKLADYIINNDGTPEELKINVNKALQTLKQL